MRATGRFFLRAVHGALPGLRLPLTLLAPRFPDLAIAQTDNRRNIPHTACRSQIQARALEIQSAICATASPAGPLTSDTSPGRGSASQERRRRRNPRRCPLRASAAVSSGAAVLPGCAYWRRRAPGRAFLRTPTLGTAMA